MKYDSINDLSLEYIQFHVFIHFLYIIHQAQIQVEELFLHLLLIRTKKIRFECKNNFKLVIKNLIRQEIPTVFQALTNIYALQGHKTYPRCNM